MSADYLKQKRILLVDDEPDLLTLVANILRQDGYTDVRTADSFANALHQAEVSAPELAVLDVMLPDGSGFGLLKRLRGFTDCPVLFLTARGEEGDRIRGFGLGADDYMVKPFSPRELLYRIAAILRRTYRSEDPLVELDGSRIDFARAEVIRDGEQIPLTAKEFALLSALCRNAGRIVTIDALCTAVWGDNPYGYENSLMAHIRRIREKIETDPSHPVSLVTVKGLGYKLILKSRK